ncbi:UNVERIFIED_CONTAM: Retrovirus-related Pol polyprotein from transposon RE2 [Sesamum latifolium]|uniref:Retrovirus-related Pol polyprotein from transposon RE2 n=1 Tax=Sesamum latifolium TaxID=2727402 RepID=A0AAW2TNJ1_9LAMI
MAEADNSAAQIQRSADTVNQYERDVLFIHPSEHSSLSLTSSPLDGTNFLAWKRAVHVSLGTKMKLGPIDGSFPRPVLGSANFELWRRVDFMVISWIWNSMSKDIVESFMFCATSQDLWLAIQAWYGRSNGPMIYQLQREISSMSQNDLSLTAYLTKVTKLWNELNALAPVPKCKCGGCSCDSNKVIDDLTSSTQLMQFLMGLHDSFNSERSQILMLDPLPDIEKTFSMVYAVEKQRAVQTDLDANSNHMACQLALNEEARGGLQRKKACVDKRNTKKGKMFAANVDVRNEETSKGQSQNVAEIVAEVLKMMQKESVPSDLLTNYAHYARFDEDFASNVVMPTEINKFCWIIDIGVTNHVCASIALFHSYAKLSQPQHIHLPDGSKRLVQYSGTVKLNNKLTLDNVLFVPQFSNTTKLLDWKTPYEKLTGNPPQYEHLRTFGALCYATNNTPHKSKFHSRVLRYILIGYAMHKKAYKLFDLDNQTVIFSRDVQFYENMFPFSNTQPVDSSLTLPTVPLQSDHLMPPPPQATDLAEPVNDQTSNPPSAPHVTGTSDSITPPPRRSQRQSHKPKWFDDFISSASGTSLLHPSNTTYLLFVASLSILQEPRTYLEAIEHVEWQEAMKAEIDTLERNSTWILTPLPKGKRPIGCKWVFKTKLRADGTVERYKARLVAKGFT